MTLQHQDQVFESTRSDVVTTTAGFDGIRKHLPLIILVSGALAVSGTSSAEATRVWEASHIQERETTASGLSWHRDSDATNNVETTRQAISDLRQISGLTWEQLGELFGVSRRSVHFWTSGKPLNAQNEQRLMQILGVIRFADRGDARATRAALFEVRDGTTAFALLREGLLEEARAILGAGPGRLKPALTELSAAAKAAREPLPPEELVDARHDRVHRETGQSRAARTVRGKQRGTT